MIPATMRIVIRWAPLPIIHCMKHIMPTCFIGACARAQSAFNSEGGGVRRSQDTHSLISCTGLRFSSASGLILSTSCILLFMMLLSFGA